MGMLDLSDMLGKALGGQKTKRKMTVSESYDILISDESDNLLEEEKHSQNAIEAVEQNGIVFLDEIDKICARSGSPWRGC